MLNKLLDVGFYVLIIMALVYTIYMMITINNLNKEIKQLDQEIEELEVRHLELELQRDALIDGAWHEHNRKMKEGDE